MANRWSPTAGPSTYCEYPANLIRIVHRFLLGVEFRLDGLVAIAPTVPAHYWETGFGQTLAWRDRKLAFRFERGAMHGVFSGAGPQRIGVRMEGSNAVVRATVGGSSIRPFNQNGLIVFELPAATEPHAFVIWRKNRA